MTANRRMLPCLILLGAALLFVSLVNIYQAQVIDRQSGELKAVADTFCGKVI